MSEKLDRREIEKVAHTHQTPETADSGNSMLQEPVKDKFDDLDLNNTLATQPDDYIGEAQWSLRKFLAAVSLAGLYVGGSIPTLLIGASMQYIGADLQVTYSSWLITANTLAIAVSSPYVGYLTDLIGNVVTSGSPCFVLRNQQAHVISFSLVVLPSWLAWPLSGLRKTLVLQ